MINQFKNFLLVLQNDSTKFGESQAAKLEKYIKQFGSGEFTQQEFLLFVSDLVDLQEIQNAYVDVKNRPHCKIS